VGGVDGDAPLSRALDVTLCDEIAPLSLMDRAMAVTEPHEGVEAVSYLVLAQAELDGLPLDSR
jgi:hypothetical protein